MITVAGIVLLSSTTSYTIAQSQGEEEHAIPTRFFENFIGTWQAQDAVLAKFPPDMAKKPLVTMEWDSEKKIIRFYEVHAPGEKKQACWKVWLFGIRLLIK